MEEREIINDMIIEEIKQYKEEENKAVREAYAKAIKAMYEKRKVRQNDPT